MALVAKEDVKWIKFVYRNGWAVYVNTKKPATKLGGNRGVDSNQNTVYSKQGSKGPDHGRVS